MIKLVKDGLGSMSHIGHYIIENDFLIWHWRSFLKDKKIYRQELRVSLPFFPRKTIYYKSLKD